MMLVGALVAVMVCLVDRQLAAALLAAFLAGALSARQSLTVTRLGANEIIAGLGFNVAVAAWSVSLKSFTAPRTFSPPGVVMLPPVRPSADCRRAILGPLISGQNILTWFAWLLRSATVFVLHREAGAASQNDGRIETRPTRSVCALSSSATARPFLPALAGLAGAHLSIGVVGLFNEGITRGAASSRSPRLFGRNKPGMNRLRASLRFLRRATDQAAGSRHPADGPDAPYLVVISCSSPLASRTPAAGFEVG